MVFQALVARKESIIKLLPGDVRWHRAAELSHNYQVNSPVLVANDVVSIPMLPSRLTNRLHKGMLLRLS